MSAFTTTDLAALAGATQGVRLDGSLTGGALGSTVAGVGDVNGDGFADVVITAPFLTVGADSQGGAAYLVFGKAGGWSGSDLVALPSNAIRIEPGAGFDRLGSAATAVGDVNGDGFADFQITAQHADNNGRTASGSSYVVFGKAAGWASLDVSTFTGGASGGVRIDGGAASDTLGTRASAVGDVNGDGFADILVQASGADGGGLTNNGAAYVVFGKAGGAGNANWTNIDLNTLPGSAYMRVNGSAASQGANMGVGGAGDMNGDGLADIAVSNYAAASGPGATRTGAGVIWVVNGGASLPDFNLASGVAGAGFRIEGAVAGDALGWAIANAGDANGDGLTDLLVSARNADSNGRTNSGSVYLIFGKSGGPGDLDLALLTAQQGIRIDGAVAGEHLGDTVAGAGDVNGDGFADFVIGTGNADNNGRTDSGSTYLIYGKASGWATMDLASLGAGGHRFDGAMPGMGLSAVAGAGDVDGDGFADLVMGASGADFNARNDSGSAWLMFSQSTGTATQRGTTLADTIQGGEGNDVLSGLSGNDTIYGGAGDDTINGGLGNDELHGGTGNDTLSHAGASDGVVVTLPTISATVGTVGAGTDFISGFENLVGSSHNDTLAGNNGNNIIEGGLGNDVMSGNGGTDTVTYANASQGVTVSLAVNTAQVTGQGTDTLSGFANLVGSAFGDRLTGSALDNSLFGGEGLDQLEGGAGNDVLDGGAGQDTASYASAVTGVTISLAVAGAQANGLMGSDTLISIENLIGSIYADTLTGDNGDNTIEGGLGNDSLSGGQGNDTVSFAAGNYANGVTVSLTAFGAQQTGAGSKTLSGFEHATGSSLGDTLTGNVATNTLAGLAGDDTLNGMGGDDVLNGGTGNDTASYEGQGPSTVSLAVAGPQTVSVFGGADTLISIENLQGSSGNDTLGGNAGDNVLDGGQGVDTVTYAHAGAGVTVSLKLQGQAQNTLGDGVDTLIGFERLQGSAFADTLTGDLGGNASVSQVQGLAGHDTLIDGNAAGQTRFLGGMGIDTYVANAARADVQIYMTSGQQNHIAAAVGGAADELLSIERIQFTDGTLNLGAWRTEDMSGRGFGDLMFRQNGSGALYQWQLEGAGVTGFGGVGIVGSEWNLVGKGDMDGDSRSDLLWQNGATGELYAFRMDGTAILSAASLGAASGWAATELGDFNGDGKCDIAFENGAGDFYTWMLDGTSVIDVKSGSMGAGWGIAATGRVNGDRTDDLVWENASTGEVRLMQMFNGANSLNASLGTVSGWSVAGTADLNGDMLSDIVFRNASGDLYGWMMNSATVLSHGFIGSAGADWAVRHVADYTGDDKADVLFQSGTTGQVWMWGLDGLSVTASGNVGTPGADWVIL
ncbi:MAG: FG-GAP-like repeat-containing protein [Acetobacteraceae bacterium]|nr:FG-GAP-like repeat-containing protein [Acetobacteraceae bacterium]